jgi:hypothetical protein
MGRIVVYLQVYGGGPHFLLDSLECWVETLHILAHWELLGMRSAMCRVNNFVPEHFPVSRDKE